MFNVVLSAWMIYFSLLIQPSLSFGTQKRCLTNKDASKHPAHSVKVYSTRTLLIHKLLGQHRFRTVCVGQVVRGGTNICEGELEINNHFFTLHRRCSRHCRSTSDSSALRILLIKLELDKYNIYKIIILQLSQRSSYRIV